MEIIVEMRQGSHLYGTDTPQSDIDLKCVFLPEARDILLQRVRNAISLSPPKASGERNKPGDIDREAFSLQRYLGLLAEGQPVALEMLFTPDSAMTTPPAPLWREIQANAHRLVTRRVAPFLGYCRRQANTYTVRAERVAAARNVLALLGAAEVRLGTIAKLGQIADELAPVADGELVALVDAPAPGEKIVRYLSVCGRKAPFTASIKTARQMVQRLVNDYGERAQAAERQGGIDWKSLSHAVRVGREAIELLETGRIAFPLRDARYLRAVKCGNVAYGLVAAEIERLVEEVEAAAKASTLPDDADTEFVDDLVARVYAARVIAASIPV